MKTRNRINKIRFVFQVIIVVIGSYILHLETWTGFNLDLIIHLIAAFVAVWLVNFAEIRIRRKFKL